MLGPQFSPPQGRAVDPSSGKEANHRGYAESGDPVYRVPGSSREEMWVQTHPDRAKSNAPFAGATFRNTGHG
jgi:hypothetical protein